MLKVATKEDLEVIKKLYNSFLESNPVFKENAGTEEEKKAYAETFLDENNPNRMIIISYEGEEPVGMIAFSTDKGRFQLETWGIRNMIWVEKEHRGKGHSKDMMDAFENWARLSSIRNLQCSVLHDKIYNKIAEAHKRMGFKPLDTIFTKELN